MGQLVITVKEENDHVTLLKRTSRVELQNLYVPFNDEEGLYLIYSRPTLFDTFWCLFHETGRPMRSH